MKLGSSRRVGRQTPINQGMPCGLNFKPGHWRADAPGSAIEEEGGRDPPPPPINHSSGGRESSPSAYAARLREATAANLAAREAALAPRRWRPPGSD